LKALGFVGGIITANGTGPKITSLDLSLKPATSSYQINQHLQKGVYRLIIVAPFNVRVLVIPLNPPPGFDFQPDSDANSEIWNSLLTTPQEGQYAFLVTLDKPVENATLHVQFIILQSLPPVSPPVNPPQPPVTPPVTPPVAPSPGDMQETYRQRGYRIGSNGAVEFYYVSFRTHKVNGSREICINGLFSWSNDLHDPALTMGRLVKEDANYRINRNGPFPTRAEAEGSAIQFAIRIFGDPTRYGIWGTGGLRDIQVSDYRNPKFR
jgi:hypothetical protein